MRLISAGKKELVPVLTIALLTLIAIFLNAPRLNESKAIELQGVRGISGQQNEVRN